MDGPRACETARVRCPQTRTGGECNSAGSCVQGYCLCKPGFSGVACETRLDDPDDGLEATKKSRRSENFWSANYTNAKELARISPEWPVSPACTVKCTSHAGLGPPLHNRSFCQCEHPGCRDIDEAFRGVTAEACAPAVNDALRGFIDECASSCTPGANATKGLGGGCAAALKTVLQDPACHELLCTAAPLLAHLPRADHATPYCPYKAPPQNGTNMTAAQAAAREEEPEDNGRNDDKAVEATKVADGADAVPYIKDGVAGDGNGGVGEWRGEDPDGQGTADPTAETSKDKFGCASQIGVSTAPTTSGVSDNAVGTTAGNANGATLDDAHGPVAYAANALAETATYLASVNAGDGSLALQQLSSVTRCEQHGVVTVAVSTSGQSVRRCACVPQADVTWSGVDCATPTRKCLSEVSPKYDHCSFAGTCNNGTCVCDGSHTGLDCRQLRCPRMCAGSSHGKCNEDGTCACAAGWGGDDCTMAVCQTPPCVWSWGLNSAGQLGHTDATTMPEVTPRLDVNSLSVNAPRLVETLQQTGADGDILEGGVTAVAAGHDFSLAVTAKGRLLSWGDNTHGKLGLGTSGGNQSVPQLVTGLTGLEVRVIACGAHHSLALTADGELYVGGKGQGGVLGLGGSPTYKAGTDVLIPTRVPNPSPSDKSDSDDTVNGIVPNGVAAGYYHSALIMNEMGDLFTWGRGTNGRLCNGETTAVSQPTSTSISGVLRVYLGGAHTIFKVGHRALMACGSNLRGQLGSDRPAATRARRWRCGWDRRRRSLRPRRWRAMVGVIRSRRVRTARGS